MKDWMKQLSMAVTNVLRHDHYNEVVGPGLMDSLGWVRVAEVLKVPSVIRFAATKADLDEVVACSSKTRMERCREAGEEFVRVVQGHSIKNLNVGDTLELFTPAHAEWRGTAFHGTGRAWDSFITHGIDVSFSEYTNKRHHVHMAVSLDGVKLGKDVGGFRQGSDRVVCVDLNAMHEAGAVSYTHLTLPTSDLV